MATVFVHDTLTGPDGQDIVNHLGELGAAWDSHRNSTPVITLQSGRAAVGTNGVVIASGAPVSSNYDVEFDLYISSEAESGVGVVGRFDPGVLNGYAVRYWRSAATIYLYRIDNGTIFSLGAAGSFSPAAGTTVRVRMELRDATKKLFLDGVERITNIDNTYTAPGRVGIRFQNNNTTPSTGQHVGEILATDTADVPNTPRIAGYGRFQGSGVSIDLQWPAHVAGDYALALLSSWQGDPEVAVPAGWSLIPGMPQVAGAGNNGSRLTVIGKLAASNAEPPITIASPGNHIIGQIITIRSPTGTWPAGGPINASVGGSQQADSTAISTPSLTTTAANTRVVAVVGHGIDGNNHGLVASEWANPSLTLVEEIVDVGSAVANGGGFVAATGVKEIAGEVAPFTGTLMFAVGQPYLVVAFQAGEAGTPPPDTVEATGAATLPSLLGTGAAAVKVLATGTATLPSLLGSGSAAVTVQGQGAAILPALAGTGTVRVPVGAEGNAVLPALLGSGSLGGAPAVEATGLVVLPSLQAAGSLVTKVLGTGGVILPALAGTGFVAVSVGVQGSAVLPRLGGTGTARILVLTTGAAILPALRATGRIAAELLPDLILIELSLEFIEQIEEEVEFMEQINLNVDY